MNPFDVPRLEAARVRNLPEFEELGEDAKGGMWVDYVCNKYDIKIFSISLGHTLLEGSDAKIIIERRHILVRNDLDADSKAFLIAHELGHFFLHQETGVIFGVKVDALSPNEEDAVANHYVESYGARERQELQANVFAREFLLPRALARKLFLEKMQSATEIAMTLEVPLELVRLQLYDALLLPEVKAEPPSQLKLKNPTTAQQPAVESDHKVTLVEAGPGTGKTTTLLLRLQRLLENGVDPSSIVILTFSNKAARELVERSNIAGIQGIEKVLIGTFHSFGLEFLRKFGHIKGLNQEVPILDELGVLTMLTEAVPLLKLRSYDALSDPELWLHNDVLPAIKRAKDELVNAREYEKLVIEHPHIDPSLQDKRLDTAVIFLEYERLLAENKTVDFNDLLSCTIQLLKSASPSVSEYRKKFKHILVDEYQDVNRTSAMLVKELSLNAETLWVVGDANQAIYGFMGASNRNLTDFQIDFPGAIAIPLDRNHRSTQDIVDVFCTVAARNPSGRSSLKLIAETSGSGKPQLLRSSNANEEAVLLANSIRDIHEQGIEFSQQAILTFSNAEASRLAQGLELQGVPVLFLGNIFERPEIADLICMMRLATDEMGSDLVRSWRSLELRMSMVDVDNILEQFDSANPIPWMQRKSTSLSSQGKASFKTLKTIIERIKPTASPWDALANILLEDGLLLRESCSKNSQQEINARMAIWQFVHFSRAPDGSNRWATVKSFPERVKTRVRLGEDKMLRHVPPEAEGLNAVRIITTHGSKGLEFDAVHFLQVTAKIFSPKGKNQWPLLPDEVFNSDSSLEANLQIERHNLLYVALSRARKYLRVYGRKDANLPVSLDNLLMEISLNVSVIPVNDDQSDIPLEAISSLIETIKLENYFKLARCGRSFELHCRTGGVPFLSPGLHLQIDWLARNVVKTMCVDSVACKPEHLRDVINESMKNNLLNEHPVSGAIHERTFNMVQHAANWLNEGGDTGNTISLDLGPLSIDIQPHQVFENGGGTIIRLIQPQNIGSKKQPLTALMQAHNQSADSKVSIEFASMKDGSKSSLGSVRGNTLENYVALATSANVNKFTVKPDTFGCPRCPHYFSCDKGKI